MISILGTEPLKGTGGFGVCSKPKPSSALAQNWQKNPQTFCQRPEVALICFQYYEGTCSPAGMMHFGVIVLCSRFIATLGGFLTNGLYMIQFYLSVFLFLIFYVVGEVWWLHFYSSRGSFFFDNTKLRFFCWHSTEIRNAIEALRVWD